MKKFKLIKEYPGYKGNLGQTYVFTSNAHLDPSKWSEYWEEIIEKDYEILSFINITSNLLIEIHNNKLYCCKDYQHYTGIGIFSLNNCLNDINLKIHSIKRLSDGEIFTIGDRLKGNHVLHEIELKDDFLKFWSCNASFSTPIKSDRQSGNMGFNTLEYLVKLKQPLFTTEDGVDIFNGIRFWNVNIIYNLDEFQVTNDKYPLKFIKDGSKQFSTKEKAEEYILLNKPCLSYGDVQEYLKVKDCNKILELIKLKINGELH